MRWRRRGRVQHASRRLTPRGCASSACVSRRSKVPQGRGSARLIADLHYQAAARVSTAVVGTRTPLRIWNRRLARFMVCDIAAALGLRHRRRPPRAAHAFSAWPIRMLPHRRRRGDSSCCLWISMRRPSPPSPGRRGTCCETVRAAWHTACCAAQRMRHRSESAACEQRQALGQCFENSVGSAA